MKRLFSFLSENWHRYCIPLLNAFWVVGLLSGILVSLSFRELLVPMLRQAVCEDNSVSGFLVVSVLPFIFCAYSVSLSEHWLLPLIGGLKALSFGFCACGVALAFGQSGWLIRMLLLFSDCITVPLLYWFSLRHISGRTSRVLRDMVVVIVVLLVVGYADCMVVSPFLARLFS